MFRRRATGAERRSRAERGFVLAPAGRGTLLVGVAAALAAWRGGYGELWVVAVVCGVCLLTALLAVLVPAPVDARLELRPAATTAGRPGRALVRATWKGPWRWRRPLVAVRMRGPDGATTWSHARLPDLLHDQARSHELDLTPVERGVVEVGPVGARRTDPLGLLVRHEPWTGTALLHVRPRLVPIDAMGTADVSDLEGAASEEISMSDLAFHALREYVRGDDLRHVHWRSSAKAGTLHVRQYHDTRRAHLVVLVDDHAASYPRPVDFELALSVAASVTLHLAQRGLSVSYACGRLAADGDLDTVLDAMCLAALQDDDRLGEAASAAARAAATSRLVLVSGVDSPPERLVAVRDRFASDVRTLALTTGRTASARAADPGSDQGLTVTNVRRLRDLPGALAVRALGVGE